MKTTLKWLFRTVLLLLIVLFIAIGALMFAVDPNDYKPEIQKLAQQQNIDIDINGELAWAFWPQLAISVTDTLVSGEQIPTVTFQSADFSLDIKALLRKQISIKKIRIKQALIRIDKGDSNSSEQIAAVSAVPAAAVKAKTSKSELVQLNIEHFELLDSTIELLENNQVIQSIQHLNVDSKNLNITEQYFPISISFETKLQADQPTAQLTFDAQFSLDQAVKNIAIDKARLTLKNFHNDIKDTLTVELDLTAQIKEQSNLILIPDARISLGDFLLTGTGALKQDTAITFELELSGNELNLNDFIAESGADTAASDNGEKGEKSAKNAESAIFTPLLVPLLLLEDGEGRISFNLQKLISGDLQLDEVVINASSTKTAIDVSELSANIFGGRVKANGLLNLKNKQPALNFSTQITQVDMQQALSTLADMDDVFGTANLSFKGKSRGDNANQLQRNLQGDGTFTLNNPKFNGMNIEQQYCKLAAMIERNPASNQNWDNYTQFQDVNGSLAISNEVATVTGLDSAMGNLSVTGNGKVLLADEAYQMKFIARLNGDRTSDTGCIVKSKSIRDKNLPLNCDGNFAGDVSCKPDPDFVRSIIGNKISKSLFNKLLGSDDADESDNNDEQNTEQPSEQKTEIKPEQQLKNLLDGLLKK